MSQITVENIKRSTETASRSTRGVAAAWVNFNGSGTVAVRDSENVASITDNATGNYTINFTNGFGAVDYLWLNTTIRNSHGHGVANISDMTTSSAKHLAYENTSALTDRDYVGNAAHGDLA